ncbi:hypothetical protein CALCODRAFT_536892 [Calocera cornea HHB12733]|uniref:DUF6532 domain-containing protein n=1 Tax=Calocera cornea HHB12733 TaxID=1353952 RepID=A0A165HIX5_9BASI|nr:hypothetical protein CALCODRAFT_536892 [Calocera cornea HHB12733]
MPRWGHPAEVQPRVQRRGEKVGGDASSLGLSADISMAGRGRSRTDVGGGSIQIQQSETDPEYILFGDSTSSVVLQEDANPVRIPNSKKGPSDSPHHPRIRSPGSDRVRQPRNVHWHNDNLYEEADPVPATQRLRNSLKIPSRKNDDNEASEMDITPDDYADYTDVTELLDRRETQVPPDRVPGTLNRPITRRDHRTGGLQTSSRNARKPDERGHRRQGIAATDEFHAIQLYRVMLANSDAFPDSFKAPQWARKSFKTACVDLGVESQYYKSRYLAESRYAHQIQDIVLQREAQLRGEVKTVAAELLLEHYKLPLSRGPEAIGDTIEELITDSLFVYADHWAVYTTAFFKDRRSDGVVFQRVFAEGKRPLLALIVTSIHCALEQWASGEKRSGIAHKFTAHIWKSIYEEHLENITEFAVAFPNRYRRIMHDLFTNAMCDLALPPKSACSYSLRAASGAISKPDRKRSQYAKSLIARLQDDSLAHDEAHMPHAGVEVATEQAPPEGPELEDQHQHGVYDNEKTVSDVFWGGGAGWQNSEDNSISEDDNHITGLTVRSSSQQDDTSFERALISVQGVDTSTTLRSSADPGCRKIHLHHRFSTSRSLGPESSSPSLAGTLDDMTADRGVLRLPRLSGDPAPEDFALNPISTCVSERPSSQSMPRNQSSNEPIGTLQSTEIKKINFEGTTAANGTIVRSHTDMPTKSPEKKRQPRPRRVGPIPRGTVGDEPAVLSAPIAASAASGKLNIPNASDHDFQPLMASTPAFTRGILPLNASDYAVLDNISQSSPSHYMIEQTSFPRLHHVLEAPTVIEAVVTPKMQSPLLAAHPQSLDDVANRKGSSYTVELVAEPSRNAPSSTEPAPMAPAPIPGTTRAALGQLCKEGAGTGPSADGLVDYRDADRLSERHCSELGVTPDEKNATDLQGEISLPQQQQPCLPSLALIVPAMSMQNRSSEGPNQPNDLDVLVETQRRELPKRIRKKPIRLEPELPRSIRRKRVPTRRA